MSIRDWYACTGTHVCVCDSNLVTRENILLSDYFYNEKNASDQIIVEGEKRRGMKEKDILETGN